MMEIGNMVQRIREITAFKIVFIEKYLQPLALLTARLYMANVFWKSGQTKISNMQSAVSLFADEYIPAWQMNSQDVYGFDLSWTVPDAVTGAYMATWAELVLSVLLALGLMGRTAAAFLLGMTVVIDLFIYPGLPVHDLWMLLLLVLVTVGTGRISLDYVVRRKVLPETLPACK